MTARLFVILVGAGLAPVCACSRGLATPPGFQGLLEYDQRILGFEVAGRVRDVVVHRGQVVAAGDVLARLDDTLAIASGQARQAELEAARADLALLRAGTSREEVASAAADLSGAQANEALLHREAERERTLAEQGAVPGADADKAQSNFDQAVARREAAQSQLAALRRGARPEEIARGEANVESRAAESKQESERLERYVLRAEAPGSILDLAIKPGEVAGAGTPAVTMADVGHPYADVFVPEGQLGTIQAGAPATARVDALPTAFSATVEYVSPETEFTPKFIFSGRERPNLVIRVRVRIDDPRHSLHSGVPVFVQVSR